MKTLSYYNKPELKAEYVALAVAHRKADEFIKGSYFKEGKGCAVGCLAQTGDDPHKFLEKKTGNPEWLYRLQDTIFEGLEIEDAKNFVVDFYQAITEGKDLEEVKWQFLEFILDENIERVKAIDTKESYKQEVLDAQELCKKYLKSRSEKDRSAARLAGKSAAWSAADSADSAAESAAWSAADSAESAAWSAAESAWSVAESAAESARSARGAAWSAAESARSAGSAAYKRYRDELLRLLVRL